MARREDWCQTIGTTLGRAPGLPTSLPVTVRRWFAAELEYFILSIAGASAINWGRTLRSADQHRFSTVTATALLCLALCPVHPLARKHNSIRRRLPPPYPLARRRLRTWIFRHQRTSV